MGKIRAKKSDHCYICFVTAESFLEHHHIQPHFVGKNNGKDNLVTLCKDCHDQVESVYESYYKVFVNEYSWWKKQESRFNNSVNTASFKKQAEERNKLQMFREAFIDKVRTIDYTKLLEACVVMIRLSKNVTIVTLDKELEKEMAGQKPKSKLKEFFKKTFKSLYTK